MPKYYITANASQYVSVFIEADNEAQAREICAKLPESDWSVDDQDFELNEINVVE
jgi:hypothetical protein